MLRFVTENSVYIIDDDPPRYMRLPRTEAGRQSWEKTAEFSWRLADNAWLPLRSHALVDVPGVGCCLRLFTPDSVYGVITSPIVNGRYDPGGKVTMPSETLPLPAHWYRGSYCSYCIHTRSEHGGDEGICVRCIGEGNGFWPLCPAFTRTAKTPDQHPGLREPRDVI